MHLSTLFFLCPSDSPPRFSVQRTTHIPQKFFPTTLNPLPHKSQSFSTLFPSYICKCTHVHMAVYTRTHGSVRMYTAMCTTGSPRIYIGNCLICNWLQPKNKCVHSRSSEMHAFTWRETSLIHKVLAICKKITSTGFKQW